MKTALVCGGGGFIGNHLVTRLKEEGYYVRSVDLKKPEFSTSKADEMLIYDLQDPSNIRFVLRLPSGENFDEIYQLAADMGGCQFVFSGVFDAEIMHNSALINLNVASFLAHNKFKGKLFYSSSACMYPQELQVNTEVVGSGNCTGLKESDAYPANPDSCYGWEKLFSEQVYLAYARNHGLNIRIARFHNIYGEEGTYQGGREKAPASICRKVITRDGGSVDVWGDGEQTRSFLYIDDCIDAVRLLMESDFHESINIGSEEMVSINELWDLAISFTGHSIDKVYKPMPKGLQGVRGRNSDNTLIRNVLNWEPKYSLKEGLERTFNWIKSQYEKAN